MGKGAASKTSSKGRLSHFGWFGLVAAVSILAQSCPSLCVLAKLDRPFSHCVVEWTVMLRDHVQDMAMLL